MALRYITDNGRTIKTTTGGEVDNGIPKTTSSSLTITNNAPSYDTVTGALVVAGGVGVASSISGTSTYYAGGGGGPGDSGRGSGGNGGGGYGAQYSPVLYATAGTANTGGGGGGGRYLSTGVASGGGNGGPGVVIISYASPQQFDLDFFQR